MKKLIMTLGLSLAVSSAVSAQTPPPPMDACPSAPTVAGVLNNDANTTAFFASIAPAPATSYFHQAMANGLTLAISGNDCVYSYKGSNILTISLTGGPAKARKARR